jgi:hypothetical protein
MRFKNRELNMRGRLAKLLLVFFLATPPSMPLKCHGTDRLPKATGEAVFEQHGNATRFRVELSEMKPASLFGGDFSTYVVWAMASPSEAENIGECVLVGSHCSVEGRAKHPAVSMFVTAEPHFLVGTPSRFVVLEPQSTTAAKYDGNRLTYNYERDSLADAKEARGFVDNNLRQAVTAVRLARRAGAAELAPVEFQTARQRLQSVLSSNRNDPQALETESRETVRLAVAAQQIADQRARQQ